MDTVKEIRTKNGKVIFVLEDDRKVAFSETEARAIYSELSRLNRKQQHLLRDILNLCKGTRAIMRKERFSKIGVETPIMVTFGGLSVGIRQIDLVRDGLREILNNHMPGNLIVDICDGGMCNVRRELEEVVEEDNSDEPEIEEAEDDFCPFYEGKKATSEPCCKICKLSENDFVNCPMPSDDDDDEPTDDSARR